MSKKKAIVNRGRKKRTWEDRVFAVDSMIAARAKKIRDKERRRGRIIIRRNKNSLLPQS